MKTNRSSFLLLLLLFFSVGIAYTQSGCSLLCNTDFENQTAGIINQVNVPCWNTTASDGMIEVWNAGAVPSYSGTKFVELNANMVSTLFQNFTAALSATVSISFAHRGRAGLDVMEVQIGPVGGPYTSLGNFSADNTAWVYNTVSYTFPAAGPTNYSLRFASISAAGGATVGNFLDAITISLPQPTITSALTEPSCPTAANGSISLNISGGSPPYTYAWASPVTATNGQAGNLLPGSYSVTVTDLNGCQNTQNFTLTPQAQPITTTIAQTACDTYFWSNNGQTYTQSGQYSFLSTSVFGCDSTVVLDLSINNSSTSTISATACASYVWNGQTYSQSGTYDFITTNSSGCDSTATLNLIILSETTSSTSITNCDSYSWNGQTFNQSGTYSYTTTNSAGCDSTATLLLTLNQSEQTSFSTTTCDSFWWNANNQTYTTSGTYTAVLTNTAGCDSTVTLNLNITISPEKPLLSVNQPECPGDLVELTAIVQPGAGVQWEEPGNFTSNLTENTFPLTTELTGNYSAYAILNNCISDTTFVNAQLVPVNTFDASQLPNVLTANKDNINDVLDLNLSFHTCMRYTISIFDRWGNELFEQSESSEPFSGKTRSGDELNAGVYFYKLNYEGGEKTGFLHLFK